MYKAVTILVTTLGAGAIAADRPIAELVVPGLGEIDVWINNQPMRWRIDPAAPNIPILSTEAAHRAKLRARGIEYVYSIGPVEVVGNTGLATAEGKRRLPVSWFPRPYVTGLDGVVGPGGLAQERVRFVFHYPRLGERKMTLPLIGEEGSSGILGGLFGVIEVGGKPMRVKFDPHSPHTLATAIAGRRLADANGGKFVGDSVSTPIAFGISRPVRPMRLAQPLMVGPITLTMIGVRTNDFGSSAGVPVAESNAPSPDPDEIVVVARTKGYDPKRGRLSLGADVLQTCSTLVFDRRNWTIELSCVAA